MIMKRVLLALIKFYRKFISPYKPPCCKYYPTCSTYAVKAVEKHGVIKGTVLSVWRLMRCNPWSLGGVDPVPEKFDFFHMSAASRKKQEAKQAMKIYFGKNKK